MSEHNHAIIWIDHHQARVFHFNRGDVEKLVIHPDNPHVHIHHKSNTIGSGRAEEDRRFLASVTEAIGAARAVLIVGPGSGKTELFKHIAQHAPGRLSAVQGVETVDHPTDRQLIAHAREYFSVADRATPQTAAGGRP